MLILVIVIMLYFNNITTELFIAKKITVNKEQNKKLIVYNLQHIITCCLNVLLFSCSGRFSRGMAACAIAPQGKYSRKAKKAKEFNQQIC